MGYSADTFTAGEQPTTAKWNKLWSNDASFNDGTGIGNGAISAPQKLVAGAGTTWAYQSWTPTFTNLSVGNGTLTSKYVRTGNYIDARSSLVFGTTTSVSGDVSITLPVTSVSYTGSTNLNPIGEATFFNTSGATICDGIVSWTSTTAAVIRCRQVSGTYSFQAVLSNLIPFGEAWATGDELEFRIGYEAA